MRHLLAAARTAARGGEVLRRSCRSASQSSARQGPAAGSSVDPGEVAKFAAQAAQWWDPNGYAAPLHRMNPVRIAFIRAAIERRMSELGAGREQPARRAPLVGASILDVGCGGGLATEPLARLGADVLGVDMAAEGIAVARAHADQDCGLAAAGNLRYEVCAAEDLVARGAAFDAVLALEVVEHVAEPNQFLRNCAALVKPGGLLVLSTLNRTAASYALGVVAAERVLRWLPEGTHDWSRFPTPHEVAASLESEGGLRCDEVVGVSFNPLSNSFSLSADTSINYILTAVKPPVPGT
jgi:2-polyprenyl-6-hydroxyphenyl methylase / 3-demethylubiquinone-9 3-methyltransferase